MPKGDRINKNPKQPDNPKRAQAKKQRNKGKLAMGKVTPDEWAKKFDPLYGLKGIKRYKAIKGI